MTAWCAFPAANTAGWSPAVQISGTNWLVPYLAETLDDPYSAVRYIGQRSLECVPERGILLVPLGGVLLFVAVLLTTLSLKYFEIDGGLTTNESSASRRGTGASG